MTDFEQFIKTKIQNLDDQAAQVTKEIERKAGPLIAKRQAFTDEADGLKKLLKEYQKTAKAK